MEICATTDSLLILRCDFIIKNGSEVNKTKIDRCNDYIISDVVNLGNNREYCYTFNANKTIDFAHPNLDGLQRIGFFFYMNTTAAESEKLGVASLSIQLTSPGK